MQFRDQSIQLGRGRVWISDKLPGRDICLVLEHQAGNAKRFPVIVLKPSISVRHFLARTVPNII